MRVVIYGSHVESWSRFYSSELWLNVDIFQTNSKEDLRIQDLILPLMEIHNEDLLNNNIIRHNYPNLEQLNIFWDKLNFYIFMITHNFSFYIPKTYSSIEEITYPCILKERKNNNGTGNSICYNLEELPTNKIVQEYIFSNEEYTSTLIVKNGKIVFSISYKYCFSKNIYIKGCFDSPDSIERFYINPLILNIFGNILRQIEYNGICNIDYKITDKLYILEINPRLGGSLCNPENKEDAIRFLKCYYETFSR